MTSPSDTKEKLMVAAIDLIWQSNYSNVGVAEICKNAGVTKGCFYHYFQTKADLFYEASQYYWGQMKLELDEIFSPIHPPLEQLERLIELIIEKQEENPHEDNPVSGCPIFTAGMQAGEGLEKVNQAAIEMSDNAIIYNAALLRALNAEKMLNSTPDPLQVGRMLHHYIMGLLMHGRIFKSLDVVKEDLRHGIYRLIDLKPEYCRNNGINT